MIPFRDVIPTRTPPLVTTGLAVLTVIVFCLEWLAPTRVWPAAFGSPSVLSHSGLFAAAVISPFLHADLFHMAANIGSLWIVGQTLEDRLGHARFLAFYIGSGIFANGLQFIATSGATPMLAGAGGAVAALAGAYLVLFPKSKLQVLLWLVTSVDVVELPAFLLLGGWFLTQLMGGLGVVGPLDGGYNPLGNLPGLLRADLAGFLCGLAAGRLLARPERRAVEWWHTDDGR